MMRDFFKLHESVCAYNAKGKPCRAVNGKWVEYNTLGELLDAQNYEEIQDKYALPEVDNNSLEFMLLDDDIEGLNKRIDSYKDDLYKKSPFESTKCFSIKKGEGVCEGDCNCQEEPCFCKNLADIRKSGCEDVDEMNSFLGLADYVPDNEAWVGYRVFTAEDLEPKSGTNYDYQVFNTENGKYGIPNKTEVYDKALDATQGFFIDHAVKDGKEIHNVDVKDHPDWMFVASKAPDSSYDIGEVEDEYDVLKDSEEELEADPVYPELVENPFFRDYHYDYLGDCERDETLIDANEYIRGLYDYVDDKTTSMNANRRDNLKTLNKENPIIIYEETLNNLQEMLKHNKKTINRFIEATNNCMKLKKTLFEGFKASKRKQESSKVVKIKVDGRVVALKKFR